MTEAVPTESYVEGATRRQMPVSWVDVSLFAGAVIWGINFAVVKQTLTEISPLAFAAVRFSLASILLYALVRIMGQDLRFARNEAWKILLLGVIGIAGTQVFFTLGIAMTTASNSSLIMATTPIFVIALGAMLRIEQVTTMVGLGVIISFLGTGMLVALGSGDLSFGAQVFAGNMMILAGTICWAIYTTLADPLLGLYSPVKIITLATITGSVVLLVLAAGDIGQLQWGHVSWQGWLGLCYSFALSSALVYAIWTTGIRKVGNTRTAVFMNVTPVVAVVASWILLGEVLGVWQIVGAVVTLTGVTLTRIAPEPNRKPIP